MHTSDSVETFMMEGLLETPNGLTIEHGLDTTLYLMRVPPDRSGAHKLRKGFYFFEVSECVAGEYRFMLSDYSNTSLDITFDLR